MKTAEKHRLKYCLPYMRISHIFQTVKRNWSDYETIYNFKGIDEKIRY